MSGTSLDGCDAALIEADNGTVRQVAFITRPMPQALRQKIMDCCSPERSNIVLACSLNAELGRWFAEMAKTVCEEAGIPPDRVACIGSHGQTAYHIAEDEGDWLASTLQLGEPAVIAYKTGIPVVSSFRAMDMAAGGRGAPLVPFAEYLLYRSDQHRALQNLGGIGNVTVLPAHGALEDVFAFDTGPANMIINALTQHFYHLEYDENGRIAAAGHVNETLLHEWMKIPFIRMPPPKATGRELYGEQFITAALQTHADISPDDWIATATRYTAVSIAENIRLFVLPRCPVREMILSGGGSHNLTMKQWISECLPECRIMTQEDLGWNSDAKEAIAFALLALETLNGRPGNVPGATGARRRVILGNITPAPFGRNSI
jgi:anhydro-N-acetylmuramic acid kinase